MIGEDIQSMRDQLGWSREKMAVELGVSLRTVCRWETGENEPSPLALDKIRILVAKLRNLTTE